MCNLWVRWKKNRMEVWVKMDWLINVLERNSWNIKEETNWLKISIHWKDMEPSHSWQMTTLSSWPRVVQLRIRISSNISFLPSLNDNIWQTHVIIADTLHENMKTRWISVGKWKWPIDSTSTYFAVSLWNSLLAKLEILSIQKV